MIELSGVGRAYEVGGEVLHALRDVDETIDSGDYVALMGPSGSGKSTLLNVMGCLDQPTSGTYRLDGREVGSLTEDELSEVRRHKIGFVFQSFHLIPRLSAVENVALPMMLAGVSVAERRKRALEALETVGLAKRADHRPNEISGGEAQRVAIARATIMRPAILLADEPTGNLDSASGATVVALLEELNAQGLTLVVVTHDPNMAARAKRVLLMRDGRIVNRIAGSELSETLHRSKVLEATP